MSFPDALMRSLSPAELEFLAENELISIRPTVPLPRICLLQGDVGPFVPPRPIDVPIWLAMILHERGMCKIEFPRWLCVPNLLEKCREENSIETFSEMPFRYAEIASLLLQTNKEFDAKDAMQTKSLLQDLREIRQSKARKGVEVIDDSHIRVDQMCMMEMNEIRPSFCRAFEKLKSIQLARFKQKNKETKSKNKKGNEDDDDDDNGAFAPSSSSSSSKLSQMAANLSSVTTFVASSTSAVPAEDEQQGQYDEVEEEEDLYY